VEVHVSRAWVTVTFMETERWQDQASCKGMDTELFYPERYATQSFEVCRVLAICRNCPVRRECRNEAIANGERHGVWGQTTPLARVQLGMPSAFETRDRSDWVAKLRGCGSLAGVEVHQQLGTELCTACAYAQRQSASKAVSDIA